MTTQQIATQSDQRITRAPGTVASLLESTQYKQRFEEVLGRRAPQFIASLTTLVYASEALRKCSPQTVIAAAIQAAALDLPIDPNLGFAYIIPYKGEARFQAGWKTYVQLAHRTGQYRNIHVAEVLTGMVKSIHPFTGLPTFGEPTDDKVVGYMAYFQLTNGFEKYLYMTCDQLQAHGKQYSKTYSRDDSKWKTDFPAMARKTVIKQLLSKWGPLSIEMRTVLAADAMPDESTGEVEMTPEQRAKVKAALWAEEPADEAGQQPPTSSQPEQQPDNNALDREVAEMDRAKGK